MIGSPELAGPGEIKLEYEENSEKLVEDILRGTGVEFGAFPDGTETEISRPDRLERLYEWREGLFQLGYLARPEWRRESPEDRVSFRRAVAVFRGEYGALFPESVMESPGLNLEDPEEPGIAPSVSELAFISGLTSFDGNLSLRELPKMGTVDIYSRVLHYRLKSLGLFEYEVGGPVDQNTMAALTEFCVILEWPIEHPHTFDLLGDVRQITELYLELYPHRPLYFRLTDERHNYDSSDDYEELFIFKGVFKKYEFSFFNKTFDQERFESAEAERIDRGPKEFRLYESQNRFGLHLTQLKLWISGYYEGLLDGLFHETGLEALHNALKMEGLQEELKQGEVLRIVAPGYGALNLHWLNSQLFARYESTDLSPEQLGEILSRESAYLHRREDEDQSLFGRLRRTFSKFRNKAERFARGVYRGVSSIYRTAVGLLSKGYAWLVRWLGKIRSGIVHIFNALANGIREGALLLSRATGYFFDYLFKRPLLTVDKKDPALFALTRFDLDADAFLLTVPNLPRETTELHTRRSRAFAQNFVIYLRLAGKFIKFLSLAATGAAWPRIGFQVIALYREGVQLKQNFQEF